MLFEVFVYGSFWFWLLIGLSTFWIMASVARDSGITPTVILFVCVSALTLFGSVNLIKLIYHNPLESCLIVIAYFSIGLVWSLFKWFLMISQLRDEFHKSQSDFMKRSECLKGIDSFKKHIYDQRQYWGFDPDLRFETFDGKDIMTLAPKANNNKSIILFWISWWPFGMIWTVAHDLFEKTARFIIDYYHTLFDRITNRVLRKMSIAQTEVQRQHE